MERILGANIFVAGHQIPATNAYDAVWSAALALNATQSRILPLTFENFTYMDSISEIMFNEMTKTNFVGVSVSYVR